MAWRGLDRRRGNTQLCEASGRGDLRQAQALLVKGVYINGTDKHGDTPLIKASGGGYLPIVQLLIDKGANINSKGCYGDTALIKASAGGYLSIVHILINVGADVNSVGHRGNTALIHACKGGHLEVVQLLVERGANVTTTNFFGDTALTFAQSQGYHLIAQLLTDCEAKVNVVHGGQEQQQQQQSCGDGGFLESDSESKRLFTEAMKHGYVEALHNVLLLIGAAGSGKTHGKHLLLGLPPPRIRQSTPLAEEAIRAMSIVQAFVAGSDERLWEMVTFERLKEMIAGTIKCWPATFKHLQMEVASTSLTKSGTRAGDVPSKSDPSKDTQCSKTPSDVPPVSHPDSYTTDLECVPDQELLDLIRSSDGSKKLFEVDWVYLIDSGGQPAFLEVLPLFIRTATAVAFFVKLNECLRDKPTVEYYGSDGHQRGSSYSSVLSNEQLLHHCARSMQSRQSVSLDASAPNIFVVGTHRDRELECTESRREKNYKLLEMLRPKFGNKLVYYSVSYPEQIIYPFNAKTPTTEDQRVAMEFRKQLARIGRNARVKLPIPWFVLEQYVDKLAAKLHRKVFSTSECQDEAKRVGMDRQACEAALVFLDRLDRFFYRPTVLKGLVFCRSQVPLDKITELIELLHVLLGQHQDRHGASAISGVSHVQMPGKLSDPPKANQSPDTFPDLSEFTNTELQRLRNYGIITIEILKKFPRHYVSGLFTPNEFLKLLTVFQVAVPLSEGSSEYVMPCLLQDLAPEELNKHRQLDTRSSAAPLLIHFQDNWVPAGIFTILIMYLRGTLHWQLCLSSGSPRCFYRNCVEFKLPTGHAGLVTLVDSYKYIEVHLLKVKPNNCQKVCPQIIHNIFEGIKEAARRLQYAALTPIIAFFCENPSSDCTPSPHLANVIDDEWVCSESPEVSDELTSRHQVWLGLVQEAGSVACYTGTSDDTNTVHMFPTITATTYCSAANCPTMTDLLTFQGKHDRINLPVEIGIRYRQFGILILNDKTGARVQGIIHHFRDNPEQINTEILRQWISGHGLQPVTWETLLQILRDIDLLNLAKDIAEVANISNQQIYPGMATANQDTPSSCVPNTTLDADNCPTMIELVRFRGKRERVNVPQEIGVQYRQLGTLLLNDKKGSRVQGIVHHLRENAEQINMEILQLWISGCGLQPVTWETLVQVLKDISLFNLARDIAEVKL